MSSPKWGIDYYLWGVLENFRGSGDPGFFPDEWSDAGILAGCRVILMQSYHAWPLEIPDHLFLGRWSPMADCWKGYGKIMHGPFSSSSPAFQNSNLAFRLISAY